MQTTSGRIKFAQEEIDTPNPEQAEEQTSSSGRIKFNPVAQEEFKSNFNIRENTGAVNIDELVSKYTNPEQPTEKKGGFLSSTAKSIANFGIGVGKGAISTLEGASSLGERMLRGVTKALLPKAAEEAMGISGDLEQTEAEKLIPEKYRTPEGTAQKAGFMTEQIAEFFIPGAASAKVGKAAKASKYLETAPKWAKELVPLLSRSLTEAGVVGTQVSIQQGKADKEALGAAGVAAAFPIAGAALSKAAQPLKELRPKVASRLINSIIKPRAGEFAYGKNPGLQIAKEGIVANSMDDLISKVSKKKAEVGRMIGDTIKPVANEIVSAKNVLNPIDDALAKLSRAPQTNSAAINRLQAVKDDILSMVANNLDDVSVEELSQLKMDIGDLAKWTGSASDDKLVNTAIQNSYRVARDIIEEKAPAITKLNERWGNLLSAEKAAKHRADILNRQDLIGLGEKVLGTGVGATTGFLLGGDAQGAVLGGVGAAGLSKLMATPAFRTRIASILAKATDAEKKQLLRSLPGIKDVIKRIFGDDEAIKLLPKLPKATGKEIAETVVEKTPKTVKSVTKKLPKAPAVKSSATKAVKTASKADDALIQEAKKYKNFEDFSQAIKGGKTQYGDYNPKLRANIPAGYENISKLGIDPEETVTVYRGIDDISGKVKRKINDGDFVTTDFDSAMSYTGSADDVVEMQVKAKDLYVSEPKDFVDEPFYTGSEYIFTTKKTNQLPTDKELTDIWKKAQGKGKILTTTKKVINPRDFEFADDYIDAVTEGKPIKLVERSKLLEEFKASKPKKIESIKKSSVIKKADEVADSKQSYMMSHRPTESGALASDITNNGEFIPKDAYDFPERYFSLNAPQEYGEATRESWSIIKKIKGKPEAEITIYRSSPEKSLNNGDWVTLSKKYANIHSKSNNGGKVHSFKVKAKDIQFAGDDINEFGYFPQGKGKAVASAKQKASFDTETMLDVMYQQAPESKKYIDDLSSKIASKFKGTVAIAPLKGRKRALEKVLEDYGGDASKLTDIARNTIVIKGGKEQLVIDSILKKSNVETWRFVKAEEDILGYSGGMVKVKTPNGQISEIQVNNPEMIFAKEPEEIAKVILGNSQYLKLQKRFGKGGEGHKYYEEFRELIKNKESNFDRIEEIQKESKEYYSRFRS